MKFAALKSLQAAQVLSVCFTDTKWLIINFQSRATREIRGQNRAQCSTAHDAVDAKLTGAAG